MSQPLKSLIDAGTKVWLDSVESRRSGSQPVVGRHRRHLQSDHHRRSHQDRPFRRSTSTAPAARGSSDDDIAWRLTDMLVGQAQEVFLPVWEARKGDDGYVSFELDPLLEDLELGPAGRGADEALHRAGQAMEPRATRTA